FRSTCVPVVAVPLVVPSALLFATVSMPWATSVAPPYRLNPDKIRRLGPTFLIPKGLAASLKLPDIVNSLGVTTPPTLPAPASTPRLVLALRSTSPVMVFTPSTLSTALVQLIPVPERVNG